MKISTKEFRNYGKEHPQSTGLQAKAYQRDTKKQVEHSSHIYSESSEGSYIEGFAGDDTDSLLDSQSYQQFLLSAADFSNLARSVKTQTQEEMAQFDFANKNLTLDSSYSNKNYLDNIDRLIAQNGRINDLLIANFIQEQLKSDINQCLTCVYNRKELEDYFEPMLRIQARLLKWRSFSVQALYDMILDGALIKMREIANSVISEMKSMGVIRTIGAERVQSLDDYELITSTGYSGRAYFGGNSQQYSSSNEFTKSGLQLLDGRKYEETRRVSRYNMFWEQQDNRCRMLTFQSAPQEYKFLFNMLVDAYLRMRQGWQNLEEIWIFLVESVYSKVSHGYLIFEDQHKLLFKQEVLENRYIEEFLKDIHRNYSHHEKNLNTQPIYSNSTQLVLSEIGVNLITLENEIHTSIQEAHPGQDASEKSHDQNNEVRNNQEDRFDEENNQNCVDKGQNDETNQIQIPATYEQLRERIKKRYCGSNLVQIVAKFQAIQASNRCILKQVQRSLKSAELMDDLAKADLKTIRTFIDNNITAERLLADVLSPKKEQVKQQTKEPVTYQSQKLKKNSQKISNYIRIINDQISNDNYQEQYQDQAALPSGQEDKAKQRKKHKNQRKKRKRQERKVIQDHIDQIQKLWGNKLWALLREKTWPRGGFQMVRQDWSSEAKVEKPRQKSQTKRKGKNAEQMQTEYTLKQPLEIKCFSKAIELQEAQNDSKDEKEAVKQTNKSNVVEIDESFEQELDQFSKRLEEQVKTTTPSKECKGRVNQASLSPQSQLVNSARRKLVPNVTQTWVGKVRQRLNYVLSANSCGNFRTPRPISGGEHLTIVEDKLANSAREPSVTTQSTATNGIDGTARGFQTHNDYQKGEFETEQDDSIDRMSVQIAQQQRSA